LVASAREALGRQLNLPPDTLQLRSVDAQVWPDSALGCPDPQSAYMQVLSPGFLLVFSDGSRDYAIHTRESGSPLIWCDGGLPKSLE
jgi:hypothetical protein